ncbi:metallophosphoesterase [Desulfoluna spongiiphila]|uniref:Calcineurin-like phosphoesterase n=1 Tax=Desulfoluna spongiiphila TaxID=419481 RepID=A0A1G5IJQ0_9BACT|nr:metallophosphoesterase [Desulfoluna spongiiphila]SCY76345.1 Calcineurin-like phosphoesterase [Desulfoluna spongiiphila]
MPFPQYDAVHVISDIHLGGSPGFQIFNQQKALAWLISHLASQPKEQKTALVLNGDIVDFLAEPAPNHEKSCYFRPHHAVEDLKRIMGDPAFAEIFQALSDYTRSENRNLIIVLGNHDVELALPEVRAFLAHQLCGDSDAARGRLTFAMDGTGFACRVGDKNMLCLHGNETDAWNPVDYRTLARISAEKKRYAPLTPWTPNAGTKMVIDVMNGLKKKYRWVDLLKPETETIPALLMAMDDHAVTWSRLKSLFGVAADFVRDKHRGPDGFLGLEGEFSDEKASADRTFQHVMAISYPSLVSAPSAGGSDMDSLLGEMDTHLAKGTSPASLALASDQPEFLGTWGAIWDKIRGRSPEENMREALRGWLKDDPTFNPKTEDKTSQSVLGLVGPEVDVVVAGHTHLHKAISTASGPAYFNSGSWIRLMQLTPDLLEKEPFKKVWAVLEKGDMDSLDNAVVNGRPLIRHIRSVVSIETVDDGAVSGALATVEEKDGAYALCPVPDGQLSF